MALSTTENYSLRKHDAGDLNWDVDMNWNMTKIDTEIKAREAHASIVTGNPHGVTISDVGGVAAADVAVIAAANKIPKANSSGKIDAGYLPVSTLPDIDTGDAGKMVLVNSTEDGFEYAALPAGTLPIIATGDAGKFLKVNSTEDGTEWSTSSSSDALNAPYELVQVLGSLTTNTTINCANGNIATCTIGGALTFTLTPSCASGYCRVLTLVITNGGAYTITWPTAVKWADGTAPTFTASGVDIVTLVTVDAGTTWYGTANGVSYA